MVDEKLLLRSWPPIGNNSASWLTPEFNTRPAFSKEAVEFAIGLLAKNKEMNNARLNAKLRRAVHLPALRKEVRDAYTWARDQFAMVRMLNDARQKLAEANRALRTHAHLRNRIHELNDKLQSVEKKVNTILNPRDRSPRSIVSLSRQHSVSSNNGNTFFNAHPHGKLFYNGR